MAEILLILTKRVTTDDIDPILSQDDMRVLEWFDEKAVALAEDTWSLQVLRGDCGIH